MPCSARDRIEAINGSIETNATVNAGGQIQIDANNILLRGDSDIQTFVGSGDSNGGDITIGADTLIALDDSDILAFSADGRGGDVDLSQTAFFGQNFQRAPQSVNPRTLDNNGRVDINATGGIASGDIVLADVSFIENNIAELAEDLVDTSALVASSCIVRSEQAAGAFTITGKEGLSQGPDSSVFHSYSLSDVEGTQAVNEAVVDEPHTAYRLNDGRLILSQFCNE